MRNHFYLRLALRNIGKNGRFYIPFLLTGLISAAIFFMLCNLSFCEDLPGGGYMVYFMKMGTSVVALFCLIFLFYTNSFLIRRRKKELGLYYVLGMEKGHIAKVLFWETAFSAVISVGGGLLCGVILNKLVFLLFLNLIHFEVSLSLPVTFPAIAVTAVLFFGIFLLVFFMNLRQVRKSDPVQLLRGGEVGEREPRVKWFWVILGVLCLGIAYTMAVVLHNAQVVITYFFPLVALVIIGTYCLFTAVSIAILKRMKRHRSYYERPRRFVSVSGMLYRMKQNAVGLASICILSTMVLVIISTTVSLYVGMQDIVETRYPTDMIVSTGDISDGKTQIQKAVDATSAEIGISADVREAYTALTITMMQTQDSFQPKDGEMVYTMFLTAADYTGLTGETLSLDANEALLYASAKYPYEEATVLDRTWLIAGRIDENPLGTMSYITSTVYLFVLPDIGSVQQIGETLSLAYDMDVNPLFTYSFDLSGSDEDAMAFYRDLEKNLPDGMIIDGRQPSMDDFYLLYGSFFFIGLVLGLTFLMATTLIIYYKQIIEGYEDRKNFVIMRRVGMEKSLIRDSVKSQVLAMFALPLVVAAIHLMFAFPLLTVLLRTLNLTNVPLFIGCTAATLFAFAVFYGLTYLFTARSYYAIVSYDENTDGNSL